MVVSWFWWMKKNKKQKKNKKTTSKHIRIRLLPEGGCVNKLEHLTNVGQVPYTIDSRALLLVFKYPRPTTIEMQHIARRPTSTQIIEPGVSHSLLPSDLSARQNLKTAAVRTLVSLARTLKVRAKLWVTDDRSKAGRLRLTQMQQLTATAIRFGLHSRALSPLSLSWPQPHSLLPITCRRLPRHPRGPPHTFIAHSTLLSPFVYLSITWPTGIRACEKQA